MKKIGALLVILMLTLSFAGCSTTQPEAEENPPEDLPPAEDNVETPEEEPNPEPSVVEVSEETFTATLYLVNDAYVSTGDESLEKVVPVEREIVKNPDRSEDELVIEQLGFVPSEDGVTTALADLIVLSVERQGDVLFIDLAPEGLNGGSLTETLVLNQLVRTGAALEGIDAVQITVGGDLRETLMGHIMIEEPLTPSDLDW